MGTRFASCANNVLTRQMIQTALSELEFVLGVSPRPDTRNLILRRSAERKTNEALCRRRVLDEGLLDLARAVAVQQCLEEQSPEPFCIVLTQQVLDMIYSQASSQARQFGENPLDLDPSLFMRQLRGVAKSYQPSAPLRAYLARSFRNDRAETPPKRAMRQIVNLFRLRPALADAFSAWIRRALSSQKALREVLLGLCEKGQCAGEHYEAVIRFFDRNETRAFIMPWAESFQTARTLYSPENYQCPIDDGRALLSVLLAEAKGAGAGAAYWGTIEQALTTGEFGAECRLAVEAFLGEPAVRELLAQHQELPWTGRRITANARRGYIEKAIAYYEDSRWQLLDTGQELSDDAKSASVLAYTWDGQDRRGLRIDCHEMACKVA